MRSAGTKGQCSVGQKRDESARPCTPDCDRRPAGAIDEAGVDGVKHGAAPARVNKVRVPQADRSPERIVLGETKQSVFARGSDARNPVLLILAGGPGGTEIGWFRKYNAVLEETSDLSPAHVPRTA